MTTMSQPDYRPTATVDTPQSFSRKQLAITFRVVNEDGSKDTLTLEAGYRIRATISHAGMSIGSDLALTIEGMSVEHMNRLSFVGNYANDDNPSVTNQSNSTVELRAGTYGDALTLVFIGNIFESFASFNGGSSTFHVKAATITALADSITDPITYRGSVPVPSILSDICTSAGYIFVDHGGWESCPTLTNHYECGTALDKVARVIRAARGTFNPIQFQDHSTKEGQSAAGAVHAWGSRYGGVTEDVKNNSIPIISPETGMIGYPDYSTCGITVNCLFRPDVSFYEPIAVRSSHLPAGWQTDNITGKNRQGQRISGDTPVWDGVWLPTFISHDLSSEVPNGPWMTHMECQRTNIGRQYALPTT